MSLSDGKDWASKYLLDPLNEPEPSAETGPGVRLNAAANIEANSKQASSTITPVANDTESQTTSPRHSKRYSRSGEGQNPWRTSTEIPTSSAQSVVSTIQPEGTGRRRTSSLKERFPGDESNRPLDMIRKSSLRAQRSPHLRKDHHHGVDTIDKLAGIPGPYHLGGPFDVVSQARNVSSRDSPVAALRTSNAEALRATPKEAIIDSLRHHRPLDNVAILPPGVPDRNGRVLHYEEGQNMQRGTGDNILRQWPGFYDYHPDDIKGKGEPSFSIERGLKSQKEHRRVVSEGFEMRSRPNPRSSLGNNNPFASGVQTTDDASLSGYDQNYREWEGDLRRSKSAKGMPSELSNLRRRLHIDGTHKT